MSIHKVYRRPNCRFSYHRIRIKKQHILCMTLANRQIVGSRKTQIMRTVYHVHTRKTLRKIIHRPVFGMIIDDKHLRLYALKCSEERIKTLLEIELHVIANDYNCNFHLIIYRKNKYNQYETRRQMLRRNIFGFRYTSRHGWIYEEDTQKKDDCHIAESWRHRLVIHKGIYQHRQTQHVDASCAPR